MQQILDEIYRLESELRNDKVINDRTGKMYGWAKKAYARLEELYYLRDHQQKMEIPSTPAKPTEMATQPTYKNGMLTMVDYQPQEYVQMSIFDLIKKEEN